MDSALSQFPNGGQVEEDYDGQLIIYTGVCSSCYGDGPCGACNGTGESSAD